MMPVLLCAIMLFASLMVLNCSSEETTVEPLLVEIGSFKAQLDKLRPLAPPIIIEKFHKHKELEFTYHSNALEGNTLDLAETMLVIEYGITVGNGKTLKEVGL